MYSKPSDGVLFAGGEKWLVVGGGTILWDTGPYKFGFTLFDCLLIGLICPSSTTWLSPILIDCVLLILLGELFMELLKVAMLY